MTSAKMWLWEQNMVGFEEVDESGSSAVDEYTSQKKA